MTKYTPDCSHLHNGMIVKNYKEMCQLVNQPILGGSSKRSQLKEWERYFDFTKQGQAFHIGDIRARPSDPIKIHRIRNGLYNGYIELLLTEYSMASKNKELTLSRSDLYQLLGMVNSNFYDFKIRAKFLQGKSQKEKTEIRLFYQRMYAKLDSILVGAFKSMVNRNLITYSIRFDQVRLCFIENNKRQPMVDKSICDLATEQKIINLNVAIVNTIYNQADSFRDNAYYSDNYVEVQKNLAEYLLRINESEAQALARKIQSGIKKEED